MSSRDPPCFPRSTLCDAGSKGSALNSIPWCKLPEQSVFTTSYTIRSHNLYIVKERYGGVTVQEKKKEGASKINQYLPLPMKGD